MIFIPTPLTGAYVIELEKREDERGFFARSWCETEFAVHGLDTKIVQCNTSFNRRKGTLRGMHFQLPPFSETKLVRCVRGSLYDVIIDVRPGSSTFLRWIAVELTADNRKTLYVPKGFAHGFQTLEDNTEIYYQMSERYAPEYGRGVRWNDPLFTIAWPNADRIISKNDQEYKDSDPSFFQALAI
jgi:dTDP-4-dehydrorhamnose 3,5-epimerase